MLRLVTLMNVRSHVIVNAAISPYCRGEIPLASEFIHSLSDNSVTLLDKGFFSADLLLRIQAGGLTGIGSFLNVEDWSIRSWNIMATVTAFCR